MANGFGSLGSGVASGMSPFLNMLYARALYGGSLPGGNQTAASLNQAELARLQSDPSTAYSNPSYSEPYSPRGSPTGSGSWFPSSAAAPAVSRPGLDQSFNPASQAGGMFPQPVPYASTLPGGANAPVAPRPAAPSTIAPVGGFNYNPAAIPTPAAGAAGFNPTAVPPWLRAPQQSWSTPPGPYGLPPPPYPGTASNPPAAIPGLGPTPPGSAAAKRPGRAWFPRTTGPGWNPAFSTLGHLGEESGYYGPSYILGPTS